MLLPDNINPQNCIYYNGALVLKVMQQKKKLPLCELYVQIQKESPMSFSILILCLDWLYLINAVVLNKKGEVVLCS